MAFTYKVIEFNKDNPYQSNIQKSGVKVEFTIGHLWDNIQALKKQVKEIEAKVGIETATMKNIIHNYPIIIQMFMGQLPLSEIVKQLGEEYKITEEERVAMHMFDRSRRFVNEAEDKLTEFAVAIEDDTRSMKEACEACKIPMPVEAVLETAADKKDKVDKIVNSEIK